jgi:hypothetical protein
VDDLLKRGLPDDALDMGLAYMLVINQPPKAPRARTASTCRAEKLPRGDINRGLIEDGQV